MKATQKNLDYDFLFYDLEPERSDLLIEACRGLSQHPKKLPPKFFYDERGSDLFQQITQLPEYYPTTTEKKLLAKFGKEIGAQLGEQVSIIEYGCGSSEKIHLLLNHLKRPQGYMAIDISKEHLLNLAQDLSETYPHLEVVALCADFTMPLELPTESLGQGSRKVAFFPGSSIGNFEPEETLQFLKLMATEVGQKGGLLIGVDLKKDPKILERAYNDAQGITAQFNLNILARLQREIQAKLQLDQFSHHAFYNETAGRIEMHLKSLSHQDIRIGTQTFNFLKGESLHTENSYKYTVEEFQSLAKRSGWQPKALWTDENNLFSLQYFELV